MSSNPTPGTRNTAIPSANVESDTGTNVGTSIVGLYGGDGEIGGVRLAADLRRCAVDIVLNNVVETHTRPARGDVADGVVVGAHDGGKIRDFGVGRRNVIVVVYSAIAGG